jgi:hypothetical protein
MSQQYPGLRRLTLARAQELAASPAREKLLDQMASATSRDQIDVARRHQLAWLTKNPDDFGVLEAGERLAHAEEALQSQRATTSRRESQR